MITLKVKLVFAVGFPTQKDREKIERASVTPYCRWLSEMRERELSNGAVNDRN